MLYGPENHAFEISQDFPSNTIATVDFGNICRSFSSPFLRGLCGVLFGSDLCLPFTMLYEHVQNLLYISSDAGDICPDILLKVVNIGL